jgi:NAD(P)H-dependent FMN reductase
MPKILTLAFTASGPYGQIERQTQAAFENMDDREARNAGLTPALFDSRTRGLASIAGKEMDALGASHELVDFCAGGVPAMDRVEFQQSDFVQHLQRSTEAATHLLWVVPVWKHQVAVSARATLPLWGAESLSGKVSAFIFVLRGSAQSGHGRSLMQDVMLQSRCWLLPRIIEAVHSDFKVEKLRSESIANGISTIVRELVAS